MATRPATAKAAASRASLAIVEQSRNLHDCSKTPYGTPQGQSLFVPVSRLPPRWQ
jgi:hypothetical protein